MPQPRATLQIISSPSDMPGRFDLHLLRHVSGQAHTLALADGIDLFDHADSLRAARWLAAATRAEFPTVWRLVRREADRAWHTAWHEAEAA